MKKEIKLTKLGFTLIELLAVIIILAIIALIATPIILDVVEDARISAGKSEAQMIYSGINNYCATEDMKYQLDNNYTRICTSSMNADTVKEMVNLENAKINEVSYNGSKLTNLVIESNGHIFKLCGNGTFVMDEEECSVDSDVGLVGDSIGDIVLTQFPYLATEGNGCTTPGDNNYSYMGGCYLKGNPTDNYIWYSGFLWRIMGINADGTVRMIVDENVTVISWGASGTAENWNGSHAKEWLNDYFYNRLKENDIIASQTWCSETTMDSSSSRATCTNNLSTEPAKVGLITIDEYNLAGSSSSYLNIGQYQWTITPYSSSYILIVNSDGSSRSGAVSGEIGLRPIINVNFNTIITGGNGIIGTAWSNESGPYILNEDKSVEVTGKLNEKAISGEYVLYAGKNYRVVDKDSNGNTKLILDGYYEENGEIYIMSYGSNNTFSTTSGIGQKLNTDILEWLVPSSNIADQNKLVTNYTWYQNNLIVGDSYKISLDEANPTRSAQATVGLIRIGEMLSGQSNSILTDGYTVASSYNNASVYWPITTFAGYGTWIIDNYGRLISDSYLAHNCSVRPVIVVNSDVNITGGNGTWSNPYEI